FRVYLGYARGAGATTALLDECRRRSGRGTDLVVGAHRVHGDPDHELRDLEVVGAGRNRPAEMHLDTDAVLARNPEGVCIDDLAETDTGNGPRLEEVSRLLAAGISVLATVHVLSIRSAATAFASVLGK